MACKKVMRSVVQRSPISLAMAFGQEPIQRAKRIIEGGQRIYGVGFAARRQRKAGCGDFGAVAGAARIIGAACHLLQNLGRQSADVVA